MNGKEKRRKMQKRNSIEYRIENNRQYRIGTQTKKVKMCRKIARDVRIRC